MSVIQLFCSISKQFRKNNLQLPIRMAQFASGLTIPVTFHSYLFLSLFLLLFVPPNNSASILEKMLRLREYLTNYRNIKLVGDTK